MMVRNARTAAIRRNVWAQIGISALVLLLPPIALGAAVYAMLPARDDGGAVADASADATLAAIESASAAQLLRPQTQPAAVSSRPLAGTSPTPSAPPMFSLASSRAEPVAKAAGKETVTSGSNGNKDAASKDTKDAANKDAANKDAANRDAANRDSANKDSMNKDSGKDTARLLGPVPVHVTVVTSPAAAAPATTDDEGATGSISAEPPSMGAAKMPAPAQGPDVEALGSRLPAAEAAPTSGARKHIRFSYLRHLARRNSARAEARSELRAARLNAQSSQHGFSLRNLLFSSSPSPRQRNARN
jgi:hypothetical protein